MVSQWANRWPNFLGMFPDRATAEAKAREFGSPAKVTYGVTVAGHDLFLELKRGLLPLAKGRGPSRGFHGCPSNRAEAAVKPRAERAQRERSCTERSEGSELD